MIAIDSPDSFVADTPTASLIRQVLGAVSEFEKAMLVEKLKGARERKRRETGKKVGGRRNYAEIDGGLELIAMAKKLHRYPVNGRRRTLADVAKTLAEAGYLSSAGTPYTPTAVSRMLASRGIERTMPRKVEAKSSSSAHKPVAAEPQDQATEVAEPVSRTPLHSRWLEVGWTTAPALRVHRQAGRGPSCGPLVGARHTRSQSETASGPGALVSKTQSS